MEKKRLNVIFDIVVLVLAAAAVFAVVRFVSPRDNTEKVFFTVVTEADTAGLSAGDKLVLTKGGVVGTVTGFGEGYIEVEAEAQLRAGTYYNGSVPLSDGRSYEICVGTKRYDGVIHRIVSR